MFSRNRVSLRRSPRTFARPVSLLPGFSLITRFSGLSALGLLASGLAVSSLSGCARELDISEPTSASGAVVAQFDPTNAIPVLQIVPSPTGLAERADGSLTVEPAPCELPSPKQCLKFVRGWPTTAPITLFFSGDIDPKSIGAGIFLYEVAANTRPVPVSFTARTKRRPAPPAACMNGENGSNPPRAYTAGSVPEGIQVVLSPATPLKEATRYLVYVTSTETAGLRAADGSRVDPSSLFSLLNAPSDQPPVAQDGTVANALLRNNVQSSVLSALFPTKTVQELTAEDRQRFDLAVQASGARLFGLYQFFSSVIGTIERATLAKREDLIFANTWTTGKVPTEIEFDPANRKIPFPNTQLLTRTVTIAGGGTALQVTLPIDPCASGEDPRSTGCDTPSSAALKKGLNTLNGFSTVAPITITASRDIDANTLRDAVVMYPVNDQNVISGPAVSITTATSTKTIDAPTTIMIAASSPLPQNQGFVIGVRTGIKDVEGNDVVANSTFSLLKRPKPLIDAMGDVDPEIEPLLQCSTVARTGSIASDAVVAGSAQALELQVMHPKWQDAFTALEGASPSIARAELLMAWNYRTQSITDTVDFIESNLIDSGVWESIPGALPRLVPTATVSTGSVAIANRFEVVETLCVPLCESGAMLPSIPPSQCSNRVTDVRAHVLCTTALNLTTANLGSARRYLMTTYRVTVGSPFVMGTFTPGSVARPDLVEVPIWVITGVGTPAAAGYPIAVFQHGITRDKETGLYIANMLAKTGGAAGWATVLMDAPFHGERASDITQTQNGVELPCTAVDPGGVQCDRFGSCTGGCDGIQDPSSTGFLGPNVFATRDNFRQTLLDQLVLLRTLREESMPGGPLDELDGTRVGYIGQSLGGIEGANLAAYVGADDLVATVLNVAGGGLTSLLVNSPAIGPLLFPSLVDAGVCELRNANDLSAGCKDTAAFRQFLLVAQWGLDPADPLATSIGVVGEAKPGREFFGASQVLIQASVPDPVVPNVTNVALGRAYGFPTDGTNAQFQLYDFTAYPANSIDSGCHGWLLAPVCARCVTANPVNQVLANVCATLNAQAQAANFLNSGGTLITPQNMNLPGLPCATLCP